ncbi:MAG: hypothetical protein M5U34_03510 [Chloroflexi bacterium]|nr:hypothetical protein [Chloroflexota bacterium]
MTTYAATDNMTNVTEVEVIRPDWAGPFPGGGFLFGSALLPMWHS